MLDGEDRIVERAVRGESSAFGLLYDHYQPMIYRFVAVKVSQREDAEDLTHQVFMSAWENMHSYRQRGFPFSSWLYRIARNRIVDHYRTKKADLPLESVAEDVTALLVHSTIPLEHHFEIERVLTALHELRPDYQDVILMRFVEELSIKETAAALEKSEGAVKLLQHRALKELKALLA